MNPRPSRRISLLTLLAAITLLLAACGSDSDDGGSGAKAGGSGDTPTLTVYFGQHEALGDALAAAYKETNGVELDIRAGSDGELANQIIEEGDSSPADLFVSEEPGPMAQIDEAGLLIPVDSATLDKVDPRFNPSNGDWLAYAARSRVIYYNPDLIDEADLPASILDLTEPEWKGRFAYAPSGAFTSTVAYLVSDIGEDATLDWLKGIEANGVNEEKNGRVRDSVEAGQHEFGLSNHYYWHILAAEQGGPDQLTSRVHYMSDGDPGALLLASGAGILASSKNQDEAQRFLAWLADPDGGQAIIAEETPQFPLAPGVESVHDLPAIAELDPPEFDQAVLSDVTTARDLIIESGIG